MRELIKSHHPSILILMETKVLYSSMGNFFNNIGFTAATIVDPVGRSGGIWLLWDATQVTIRASHATNLVIQATIHKEDYEEWLLSAVYASPNASQREELWDNLEETANSTERPWLVAGDFNDFTNSSERRSFSTNYNHNRAQKFTERINNCNLIDLGSVSPGLTWSNNRRGLANTMERLDRAMSNDKWRALFPEGTVRTLPRTYSDHSSLIVLTQGMHPSNPKNRPFRFEAAWLCHPSFSDVVLQSWAHMNTNLVGTISEFTQNVKTWNQEVFGNVFKRKRALLARIEVIQKAQTQTFSHNLFLLEQDLITQYNSTLFQEELLWFQKSRVKWLTLGDLNTKFFHITTLNKCRKLKINLLKDESGNWLSNPEDIKTHIQLYFSNLFKQGENFIFDHWKDVTSIWFTRDDNQLLQNPITNQDVWHAIKSIKAFKAPGTDGLQAIFYRQNWNIVGPSVCAFVQQCFNTKNIPEEVNATQVVLIPKLPNPETIKHFRPISLCNVTYKIITKIIVNRIRPLLPDLISPNQSSFILGRTTTDNVIITQEIIHTLRNKKGKPGGMVFKIDLEKAYDFIS